MSMVVVGVVGAVATVGAAGMQAYSANKAGKDAKSAAGQAASQFQATGQKADSYLARYERLLRDPGMVLALTQNVNNANYAGARDMSVRLNNFNREELTRNLSKVLPGYQRSMLLAQRNTRSWIQGKLPNDVAAAVEDRAAERATAFGLPAGGANQRAMTARDLGRTSLELMQQGENSLQRWIGTAKTYLTPALANPMDFLMTPQQYTNTVLAGADVATRRANIITGAGNNATTAYLQGEQAGIAADQAQMAALSQGLEALGGMGMSYAQNRGGGAGASMAGAPRATPTGRTWTGQGWQQTPSQYMPSYLNI